MANGQNAPRSSDLMVVAAGGPPEPISQQILDYWIMLARQMHDPGDIRSGRPWASGGKTPFLNEQGVDTGGWYWPNQPPGP